jgi:formylglycine-generating enzyme required for sulfatase activity
LSRCVGDVGKSISAGNRQIRWAPLDEKEQFVGDGIQFKVVALNRKPFEPEMVFVEGGTFMMGSTSGWNDEKPQHEVGLSSFFIGKFEVTQAEWKAVMGSNPSYDAGKCDQCPVNQVSWNDAIAFIKKLNQLTGKSYRLPTEAEWEYAARGGKWGDRISPYSGSYQFDEVGWAYENSINGLRPVGLKKPNELGIYDMTGNAREWCSDWYGLYPSSFQKDPKGPLNGEEKVLRGLCVEWSIPSCQVSNRWKEFPIIGFPDHGLRLVLPATK